MPTFTPPTRFEVPPVSEDPLEIARNPIGYALMRHYRARPAGRNVYIIDGTTVTETDPTTTYHADGSIDEIPLERITRFFQGGTSTPYEVTDEEAALLTAAGYTVD